MSAGPQVGVKRFLHFYTGLGTVAAMTAADRPLRVPISEATKRGVSWLNETAAERRVLLTRFGRVNSVVDSAERLDASAAKIDAARREVVEHYADEALSRSHRSSLEDVCSKLGIDVDRVRKRAAELRG